MLLALLALISQVPASSTVPGDSSGPDVVYYGGKRVIFYARKDEVLLLDSAWVRYGAMSVYSDSIRYDVKLHRLTAHRDVLFTTVSDDKTENITGVEMLYDIDTRKGMMRTARTAVENGFFRSDEVWLVHERVLNARRASYTTCDHEHPHYAFYGPRVKLLMDDVAIAEPMLFKLGPVPVLGAPFWMVPVASKRKSGLMPFKVGSSATEGFYSKNMSYYWVINDYSDLTFTGDLMTKKGLQLRTEGIYIVRPYANGQVVAGYIDEWDTRHRRYSVDAKHESERFFLGTRFSGQLNLVSDAKYVSDYSEEKLDWLSPNSYSSARLTRPFGKVGSFSATATRDVEFSSHYRYYELPSAQFSFSALRLGAGWNASPRLSVGNRVENYSDSLGRDTAGVTRRNGGAGLSISSPQYRLGEFMTFSAGDGLSLNAGRVAPSNSPVTDNLTGTHNLSLSLQQSMLGTGIITEAVSMNQANNFLDSLPATAGYGASLSGQLLLYRVYSTEALGMHGLLHTATPKASIGYTPQTAPGGFFGKPDFLKPNQAALTFGLDNTFQAKVDSARTKRDLGYVNLSSGYDLVAKKLNPVSGFLSFQPLQASRLRLDVQANAAYDIGLRRFTPDREVNTTFHWDGVSIDTASKKERGIQLGLSHTYGTDANMLTGSATLAGYGWKLSVAALGYNFKQHQLTDYDVSLWRDLHCWEAIFTYRRLGTRWDYDFIIRIKKLPDIRFGRSTFGSLLPSPP